METTIHGRVVFDLLPYMFRNHKLSSYSLNSVSAEFLGQQKVSKCMCTYMCVYVNVVIELVVCVCMW